MRIAIVHSFYASATPSGENTVVQEQVDALTEAGHDVLLVARRTDSDSQKPLYPLRSAAHVISGQGPDPTHDLRGFRPDLVHLHNLFPNFGTRWLRAWRGPVVATLHNFRPICANGLLFRDGHYCDECPTTSALAAVRYGCYHGSRVASIPLALRNARGPGHDDVLARADAIICLSEQAAAVYRRLAGDSLPIHVVPNGMALAPAEQQKPSNGRWVVVSRLTGEKGVRELVDLWPDGESLDVIGSGPEEEAVRALRRTSVAVLGSMPRGDVLDALPSYEGLVFPSLCLEMQPTVLVEALAAGLPIVALDGSAGADVVRSVPVGMTYRDRDSLAEALRTTRSLRTQLSAAAQSAFQAGLTRESWVARLEALYVEVAGSRSRP